MLKLQKNMVKISWKFKEIHSYYISNRHFTTSNTLNMFGSIERAVKALRIAGRDERALVTRRTSAERMALLPSLVRDNAAYRGFETEAEASAFEASKESARRQEIEKMHATEHGRYLSKEQFAKDQQAIADAKAEMKLAQLQIDTTSKEIMKVKKQLKLAKTVEAREKVEAKLKALSEVKLEAESVHATKNVKLKAAEMHLASTKKRIIIAKRDGFDKWNESEGIYATEGVIVGKAKAAGLVEVAHEKTQADVILEVAFKGTASAVAGSAIPSGLVGLAGIIATQNADELVKSPVTPGGTRELPNRPADSRDIPYPVIPPKPPKSPTMVDLPFVAGSPVSPDGTRDLTSRPLMEDVAVPFPAQAIISDIPESPVSPGGTVQLESKPRPAQPIISDIPESPLTPGGTVPIDRGPLPALPALPKSAESPGDIPIPAGTPPLPTSGGSVKKSIFNFFGGKSSSKAVVEAASESKTSTSIFSFFGRKKSTSKAAGEVASGGAGEAPKPKNTSLSCAWVEVDVNKNGGLYLKLNFLEKDFIIKSILENLISIDRYTCLTILYLYDIIIQIFLEYPLLGAVLLFLKDCWRLYRGFLLLTFICVKIGEYWEKWKPKVLKVFSFFKNKIKKIN